MFSGRNKNAELDQAIQTGPGSTNQHYVTEQLAWVPTSGVKAWPRCLSFLWPSTRVCLTRLPCDHSEQPCSQTSQHLPAPGLCSQGLLGAGIFEQCCHTNSAFIIPHGTGFLPLCNEWSSHIPFSRHIHRLCHCLQSAELCLLPQSWDSHLLGRLLLPTSISTKIHPFLCVRKHSPETAHKM